jgi:hypothetical protein
MLIYRKRMEIFVADDALNVAVFGQVAAKHSRVCGLPQRIACLQRAIADGHKEPSYQLAGAKGVPDQVEVLVQQPLSGSAQRDGSPRALPENLH